MFPHILELRVLKKNDILDKMVSFIIRSQILEENIKGKSENAQRDVGKCMRKKKLSTIFADFAAQTINAI